MSCEECGCDGPLITRARLSGDEPLPVIHFGLIASGDTVLKSAEHRDDIAPREGVIAFEMEGSGVWELFPRIVIKGGCNYADSHMAKAWQHYAAASAQHVQRPF